MALLLFLSLAAGARADLLVTNQGESLSGELSRVLNGILVFRTSMRGQMMVPMTEVKSLVTDTTWAITDQEGTVHIGRFAAGGVEAVTGGGVNLDPVSPAEVVSAKQIPSGLEASSPPEGSGTAWTAQGGVGVRAFQGTEDGMSPHARLGVRGGDARGDVNVDLGFDLAEDDGFPSYFRGRFEAAAVQDRPWVPFVQALAERDRHKDLSWQTGLTVGVRHDFDAESPGGLYGIVGLGGTLARWADADQAVIGPETPEDDRTQADLNLHLELRYSRALWGRASWDSRLYLLPGLTGARDFRAGAESSLIYPVTSRLQLRLDMLMGYEDDPIYESIDRVDTSLGASIQLNF